jgi:hypothetical protein
MVIFLMNHTYGCPCRTGERIAICEPLSEDGLGTLSNWTADGDSSHEPHLYTGVAEE